MPTSGPDSAGSLAARCVGEGADLVLVLGGDGTINEVANGMAHSRVPLGILPGGTANVLAMEMKMGADAVRAASHMDRYIPVRVASGLLRRPGLTGRHFLLMAGVGLDAFIVYNLDQKMKARIGKGAYWLAGFSQVGRKIEEFDVVADGRRIRAGFALCSRVRNYGGDLEIARGANLLEECFELVAFEGQAVSRYLAYFAALLAGRLPATKGVTILRVQRAEFLNAGSDVHVQLDGEGVGRPPASVEIVPDAITLLMPPAFLRRARERQRASWSEAVAP